MGTYNGQFGAFLQPQKYGRGSTGNYSVLTWRGDKTRVEQLARQISETIDVDYEINESFGTCELTVHYPWTFLADNAATDYEIKWEFFANTSNKDLLEAQVESNAIGLLSQYQISLIRQLLQNPPSITKSVQDSSVPPQTVTVELLANTSDAMFVDPNGNANDPQGTTAHQVWNLMMLGVRDYPIFQPVIRRTLITSNLYLGVTSIFHVRKILSRGTLISTEGIPNDALFYNLMPNDISTNSNLAFGWLKTFPTVQEVALRKYQIVQEWQYGLWATLIWGTPL